MTGYTLDHGEFVMTISDDEVGSLNATEEAEIPASHEPSFVGRKRSKKRKRGNDDNTADSRDGKGKNKRTEGFDHAQDLLDEGDLSPSNGGEDDGALDPDFEFQTGDFGDAIREYEGWDFDSTKLGRHGDKKAVDIDEIIARRLVNKAGNDPKSVGDQQLHKRNNRDDSDSQSGFEELREDDSRLLTGDGFGMGAPGIDQDDILDEDGDDDNTNSDSDGGSDGESVASPVAHPDDVKDSTASSDNEEDPAEIARREAFFAPEEKPGAKYKTAKKPPSSFQSISLSRPILRGLASVGF